NLWVLLPEDGRLWDVWALFVMMVLAATLSLITIFLYKNRLLQIRLCTFSILLVVGWYAAYAAFACLLAQRLDTSFSPHWSASMPFAALVLLVLAWRGIARDERLVKSLDRLR
ncbi:MAG: DUF4293 domain-containing protein, partial [Bacteroidaceae bacterium]|nr:DUF4293 domain-containing protein [Bacteroidaceae bacterium]